MRNVTSFVFSQKGLAVLAFMLILFVFMLNTRMLCGDIKPEPIEKAIQEARDRENGIEVPAVENETMIGKICRLKSHMSTNIIVAFLVLTVVRQVMLRTAAIRDRR